MVCWQPLQQMHRHRPAAGLSSCLDHGIPGPGLFLEVRRVSCYFLLQSLRCTKKLANCPSTPPRFQQGVVAAILPSRRQFRAKGQSSAALPLAAGIATIGSKPNLPKPPKAFCVDTSPGISGQPTLDHTPSLRMEPAVDLETHRRMQSCGMHLEPMLS